MKKSSKLLRVVLCALLALCVGFCLFACTPEENADPAPPPSSGDGNEPPTPTPPLKEFTGIAFESKTVDYDGSEHSIVVSGTLPDGAKVDYENNAATNAGEYSAKANELMESMPDELKGFLKDYFDILSSGLKEEEEK